MKRCVALILTLSSSAWAGNFAECILDKMPGTANDVAASAVWQVCRSAYPGGIESVKQGDGRGFFGYSNGNECLAKKASDTQSQRAALMIGSACRRLYDEPNPFANPNFGK